ncbi:hypothetical protein B6U99_05570 [Candidatus Geothermarchaeota archaeon ex4572_27]|nr:MAG: hypothetical protein B6U99_05570 [Candidatus Geothermarchaeota archaeon ex4572_27]
MRKVSYQELSSTSQLERLRERGRAQLEEVLGEVSRIVREVREGQLEEVLGEVSRIVREVREGGDEALRRLAREVDGVEVEGWSIEAERSEVEEAYRSVGEAVEVMVREEVP